MSRHMPEPISSSVKLREGAGSRGAGLSVAVAAGSDQFAVGAGDQVVGAVDVGTWLGKAGSDGASVRWLGDRGGNQSKSGTGAGQRHIGHRAQKPSPPSRMIRPYGRSCALM